MPAINTETRLSGEGTTAVDVIVMRSHALPSIIHTDATHSSSTPDIHTTRIFTQLNQAGPGPTTMSKNTSERQCGSGIKNLMKRGVAVV